MSEGRGRGSRGRENGRGRGEKDTIMDSLNKRAFWRDHPHNLSCECNFINSLLPKETKPTSANLSPPPPLTHPSLPPPTHTYTHIHVTTWASVNPSNQ